jgi:lipopolysaccharide transport system permease protein
MFLEGATTNTNAAWPGWIRSPFAAVGHFLQYRYLLSQLVRREVAAKYRGSWLGPVWPLLAPLLMLSVYTFVFSVVFQSRWGNGASASHADFVLALFVSLTTFNLFAETVTVAPGLIVGNANYVRRVVFPLEILPVARFLANLVQAGLAMGIYLVAMLIFKGRIPWTIVLLPLVVLPLALLTVGLSLFLSSLGVFVRDVGQLVGLGVTMLMFLSAVFYPLASLPPSWLPVLCLNPLVLIVEDARRVCLNGLMPQWGPWCAVTSFGMVVMAGGFTWFMKSKNAFADVL